MRTGHARFGQGPTIVVLTLLFGLVSSAAQAGPADEVWFTLGPAGIAGAGSDRLELGLGSFDALDDDSSPVGSLEYRFGSKLVVLGPALGLLATVDGGLYGYVGLYLDLALGRLTLTPMLAAGGYKQGGGPDLGGVFQFRESVALSVSFDNGHRLGLKVGHVSNANIHHINPGAEDLMVTYALPLGPLL